MRIHRLILLFSAVLSLPAFAASTTQPTTAEDVKSAGAFAFPQAQAQILCDTPDLRVSAWNDAKFLYVQAIVWTDSDETGTRQLPDGRVFGDASALSIDVDADAKPTPDVDRTYYLNPLATLPGLQYTVALQGPQGTSTGLRDDSAGRGAIRYWSPANEPRFRIDSFVIPLSEIRHAPGDTIRFAYWAYSLRPPLALNSPGLPNVKYVYQIPFAQYHTLKLADRPAGLDPRQIPDDRNGR